MTREDRGPATWPTAMAEVLSCRYEMRAGRALAFGLPSSRHFHLTYQYWIEGERHTGDCYTAKPRSTGSLIELRYDPEQPHRSQQPGEDRPTGIRLLGTALLIALVFAVFMAFGLRGCGPG